MDRHSFEVVPLDASSYVKPSARPIQFNKFMAVIFKDGNPKEHSASFLKSGRAVHEPIRLMPSSVDMMDDAESRSKIRNLMNWLEIEHDASIGIPRVLGTILTSSLVHATENRNLLQDKVTKTFRRLELSALQSIKFEDRYNRELLDRLQEDSLSHASTLEDDGSNIAQFLFGLKNSPKHSGTERYQTIKKQFEHLFSQELTIEPILERHVIAWRKGGGRGVSRPSIVVVDKKLPEPDTSIPTRYSSTTGIAVVDKKLPGHLPLAQVGSGARSVIYMLAAVYGTKNSIVMLDEPGINIHPTMLQGVVGGLVGRNSDNQILVVTHSPDLLRNEALRGKADIICVRNIDRQSKIFQVKSTEGRDKNDHGELGHQIDPEVFFAKLVILVEGKSDRALLGLADIMAAKDHKYDLPLSNIAVVSVGGKPGFRNHRKLLDEYRIPWVILADEDASEDVFKSEKVSWISKAGVEGKEPVYLIRGDLEALMKDTDPDTFDKVGKQSKVNAAFEFVELLLEKNQDCADFPIVTFLDRVVERTKSHTC